MYLVSLKLVNKLSKVIDLNKTQDSWNIALSSFVIRLRSEDLHHLILGYRVPDLQG